MLQDTKIPFSKAYPVDTVVLVGKHRKLDDFVNDILSAGYFSLR